MVERPPRAPGIADVARMAGVSVATVSRVLNDPGVVSERRRTAVQDAIVRLGYRPNEAARALKSGRQKMIGVITGNTTRYGFASVLRGIEEAAREGDFLVTITVVENGDPDHVRSAVELVLSQPLSGIIGIEFDEFVTAALARIPTTMPTATAAMVGTNRSGLPYAWLDDELGARLATEHLLALGHRTVHHLAVDYPNDIGHGRTYGYLAELAARDAPVPPVVATDWAPMSARAAAIEQLPDDATAVFCFNDEVAMGVLRAMADQGRAVPGDVSVVGFDDMPLAEVWTPGLTTVRMDFAGLGRAAFEVLRATMAGAPPPTARAIRPSLVVRGSSGAPRAAARP
ncbi:LacI family transcriptional regulator [Curtobacterium sp. MCBD17_013]|uniref:LacI family DNA-binding transcriptional regulator n=1 Tax=Curtobacterium sp. MCBD17_013 TaxID=2175668 RepID=UPI000DA6F7C2|nr:LacI family DNA-binding transcriptional regulator [Curtobacterium sp. MCBD17_013]PZF66366.1 LacI family transcriptional regulator [Curtobacterium sp. MCBD17_013]